MCINTSNKKKLQFTREQLTYQLVLAEKLRDERSYAKNKTFAQVMKELQSGSGTRYSTEIVQVLTESSQLQQKLEKLLLHERERICLHMYRKMKGLLQE